MITLLASAFMIGLLGSLHCIGMCGGLVGALCMARPTLWWPGLLTYQIGRIASYAALGILAGALGTGIGQSGWLPQAQQILAIFAAIVMILFALYLGGWLPDPLARLTAIVSRASGMAGWAQKAAHGRNPGPWLAVGLLNGLLPCGLVYAALALSLTAQTIAQGAATMLAFGLGTVPAMMAAPALMRRLSPSMRGSLLKVAAILLIALAILTVLRMQLHAGHEHGAHEHASHEAPAMERQLHDSHGHGAHDTSAMEQPPAPAEAEGHAHHEHRH